MNIQNFETAYLNAGGKASELEKEDGEYVSSKSQMCWQMWQAAAQVVPEGFVLVAKEPTEAMIHSVAELHKENAFMTYVQIYKAMVEAQEQSHV